MAAATTYARVRGDFEFAPRPGAPRCKRMKNFHACALLLLVSASTVGWLQKHLLKTSMLYTRAMFKSSWKCLDACCGQNKANNRSCVLRNVCTVDGKLLSFGRKGLDEPLPSWYGSDRTFQEDYHPVLTLEQAKPHLAIPVRYLRGATIFIEYAHFNIAHTMLDMVYPVFVSLSKLGLNTGPEQPLRILHRLPHSDDSQIWFLHLIGDLGVEHIEKMEPTCFEMVVVGGGNQGLLSWDPNYAIPGARDGALKAYRNMIYAKAKVPFNESRTLGPNITVLLLNQHKRPIQNIQSLPDYIKEVAPHAHVRSTNWESIVSDRALRVSGWREHQIEYHREIADFREKLHLLKTTNVIMAGVGTSHLFEFLLLDGSVSINYGTCENFKQLGTFYDDYLIPGIDWVRGLYYVNKTSCDDSSDIKLPRHSTQCLIKLAIRTIRNPPTTINVSENLSPFGKAVSAMARRHPKSWASLRQPPCKVTDIAPALLHNNTDEQCLHRISTEALSTLRSEFLTVGAQYPCV